MRDALPTLIFIAGFLQWSVLIASSLVPLRLEWRKVLAALPRLHRQMYWVYGGYVVLAIVANGLVCVCFSAELAAGSGLARGVCGYIAVFWGIRVSLQAVLDVKEHLTTWWLTAGYHVLTVLFASFTVLFAWAALARPPSDSLKHLMSTGIASGCLLIRHNVHAAVATPTQAASSHDLARAKTPGDMPTEKPAI